MSLRVTRRGKIRSAEDAARLINDGDTLTISGVLGWMHPAKVMRALEVRFLEEGHPRGLTWFDPFPTGIPGQETFAHAGMLKRVVAGWFTPHPNICRQIAANEIEAYLLPLGTMGFLCQQIAAGRAGLLTKTGLDTYMDPAHGGARLNERTTEDLVARTQVDGEDYLWLRSFPIDVAIIRGSTVDEAGNLSLEDEHATMSVLYQAMAAKRCGGKVIVQAKRLVSEGEIHPRIVAVPGIFVDAIVLDPDQHPDEANHQMDWLLPWDRLPKPPARVLVSPNLEVWRQWIHEGVVDDELAPAVRPLVLDTMVARRCALELARGDLVNIGAGLAARDLLPVAVEEEIDELCCLSIEPGHLGGWVNGALFRANTQAILSTPDIFSVYASGMLSKTVLSMIEFDRDGSVNLLRYGDTLVGPGGSMDIAEGAPKVVFCGTFSAGGLQVAAEAGRLRVVQEGRVPRHVERVQAVCFNGRRMHAQGKEVLYLTERAGFRLTEDGPELFEVAPGIDVERDVVAPIGFRPLMADEVRTMDARIYQEGPMGLGAQWTSPPTPSP
jgi:propionate CoA-transferase